ncbi:MAG TPA: hypothetical protein VI461_10555 [Chitinophagaceae bacterium]|nr:hypothetical protein [Chitinophagaceae bacterium]
MSEEKNIPEEKSENKSFDKLRTNTENANEHFPEDSHAPKQPQTINDKQETADMEVHKHPHHVTHKKKWGEYLLEFLMLFLAVFLGFLAENQREHIVERQRAKEYAKALLEDLAKDTLEIQDVIREDKILLTCFDSIQAITHGHSLKGKIPGRFYYYCNIGTASPAVVWANATITQITQSGNLRYFTNTELIKKISSYYSSSQYITELNNIDRRFREKAMELKSQVLDSYFFSQYSPYPIIDWPNIPDSLMTKQLPLHNPEKLNEFSNSLENRRANFTILINRVYPAALNAAVELMSILRKDYHLK